MGECLVEDYSSNTRNLSLQDVFPFQLSMGYITKYMGALKHSSRKFYFGSKIIHTKFT
jgi:hypothetical protein